MIESKDIFRFIRQGESETLEFKESFGKDVIETVCATEKGQSFLKAI